MKTCKFCSFAWSVVERVLGACCPKPKSNAKALDDLIDSIDKGLAARMMGDGVFEAHEASNGSNRQSALAKLVSQSLSLKRKPDQSV